MEKREQQNIRSLQCRVHRLSKVTSGLKESGIKQSVESVPRQSALCPAPRAATLLSSALLTQIPLDLPGRRDFPRMPFLPPPAVPCQRAGQLAGPRAGLLPAGVGLSPPPPTRHLQNQTAHAGGAPMTAWGYLGSERGTSL